MANINNHVNNMIKSSGKTQDLFTNLYNFVKFLFMIFIYDIKNL